MAGSSYSFVVRLVKACFALKVGIPLFLCSLCVLCVLRGSLFVRKNNHRGTEHAEVTQRRSRVNDFWGKPIQRLSNRHETKNTDCSSPFHFRVGLYCSITRADRPTFETAANG